MPRKLGPYTVIEKVGKVDYKLDLPKTLRVHPVFHINRLSLWKGNKINGILPPPPEPVEVEGEEEYEVEEVLDSKVHGKGLRYLVKWKGYDESENSWEPVKNLKNAQVKVKEFHWRHPSAPRPVQKFAFATYQWEEVPQLTDGLIPRTKQLPSTPVWEFGKLSGKESRVRQGRQTLEGGAEMALLQDLAFLKGVILSHLAGIHGGRSRVR